MAILLLHAFFLFNYQLGWMYGRYFLWNFAGRQNDVQGFGGTPGMGGNALMEGNWISGLNFIDNQRLGNQEILPSKITQNKGNNKYYYLPLILGLIGFFFHLWRNVGRRAEGCSRPCSPCRRPPSRRFRSRA